MPDLTRFDCAILVRSLLTRKGLFTLRGSVNHYGRFDVGHPANGDQPVTITVGTPAVPDYLPTLGDVIAAIQNPRGGEWAVAIRQAGRTGERIYGTQLVHWDADLSYWACHGNGHYDMTRDAALRDLLRRCDGAGPACDICETTVGGCPHSS